MFCWVFTRISRFQQKNNRRKKARGQQVEYYAQRIYYFKKSAATALEIYQIFWTWSICFLTIFLQKNYSHPRWQYTFLVQFEPWKLQTNVWNLFKVNNNDIRTTSHSTFKFLSCFHCNLGQVNNGWARRNVKNPFMRQLKLVMLTIT